MASFCNQTLLSAFLIFFSSCSGLLYYPNSFRYVDEKRLDYPPVEVELSAGGERDLLSWYFEARGQTRKPVTIIFAHGNGQNMSAHFRNLYWVLEKGLNFFVVGYPGYGPNEGHATPSSTVEVVSSAITWVKNNRPNDAILVYGQSLGGNVALRAVSESHDIPFCGVVIEGSFLSYKKAAQQTMARSWLLWSFQWLPYLVISDSKSIGENLMNLPRAHYLVIHGTEDQSVSFSLGHELFDHMPEPKNLWAIEGGKHIDTFARHPEKRDEFINFVDLNCLSRE